MLCVTAAAALAVAVAPQHGPEGTCGFQCEHDHECAGCPGARHHRRRDHGKCSSPAAHTPWPTIAATCVNEPTDAPRDPAPNVADAAWPRTFAANTSGWVYEDFTDAAAAVEGYFRFDAETGHLRSDYHPYINGQDSTQIWIGKTGSEKSDYYVKSGLICIYFGITDPGPVGGSISIMRPDWMPNCERAGHARYVGREMVNGEWADHWACILDYHDAHESGEWIVFQNWHSLGLGATPRGMPLRVTGGNSEPKGQEGQPRLANQWRSHFNTGPDAVQPGDFAPPTGLCIPVGAADAAEWFGAGRLTPAHAQAPGFMHRAHYLPHAKPAAADLIRARQAVPRAGLKAATLAGAMEKLNAGLRREEGLATKACGDFDVAALQAAQRELFAARSPALQRVYAAANGTAGDNRRLPYATTAELAAAHRAQRAAAAAHPEVADAVRDGLCHEAVMQYVHHLTDAARRAVRSGAFVLPRLPEGGMRPAPPPAAPAAAAAAHKKYAEQVTCAICHVA